MERLMVKCQNCAFADNPDGAAFCAKCGQPISETRGTLAMTGLLTPNDALVLESRSRTRHIDQLKRFDIAIYIEELEEPLILPLTRDLVLGRFGGLNEQPPIDLAAFRGAEQGVSRKHAMLRRLGRDIVIIDLDSTNGTWLNGIRIPSYQPVTVRDGDRVLLGRLPIQIYFGPDR
jgi:hypothetical protein